MRTWQTEFGEWYDVPKFIDFLVAKDVIEDHSWHNDAYPSFGIFDEDGEYGVRMFVGHPLKDFREDPNDKRFMVIAGPSGEEPDHFDPFDDLQLAVEKLFERIHDFKAGTAHGVKEWRPGGAPIVPEPWDEPGDYLKELLVEFHENEKRRR